MCNQYSSPLVEMLLEIIQEFIGSFILLFSIIASGNPWIVGVVFAGLLFIGRGAHDFNPASTIMAFFNGGKSGLTASLFIVAQVTAAALAVFAYKKIY